MPSIRIVTLYQTRSDSQGIPPKLLLRHGQKAAVLVIAS